MEKWLNHQEAKTHLGIDSDHTMRRLVQSGRLDAYKFGRNLLYRPEDLDRLVVDSRVGAAGPGR